MKCDFPRKNTVCLLRVKGFEIGGQANGHYVGVCPIAYTGFVRGSVRQSELTLGRITELSFGFMLQEYCSRSY